MDASYNTNMLFTYQYCALVCASINCKICINNGRNQVMMNHPRRLTVICAIYLVCSPKWVYVVACLYFWLVNIHNTLVIIQCYVHLSGASCMFTPILIILPYKILYRMFTPILIILPYEIVYSIVTYCFYLVIDPTYIGVKATTNQGLRRPTRQKKEKLTPIAILPVAAPPAKKKKN